MSALRLIAAIVTLGALAAMTAVGSARSEGGPADAKAAAYGVQVIVPGADGTVVAGVVGPPDAAASLPDFAYGDTAVTTGAVSTTATTTADQRADAVSTAAVDGVSLFGGEITIEHVEVKASGGASPDGADGSVGSSSVSGLVVLGQAVDAATLSRAELADWGYLVVLEQAVSREDADAFGFSGSVAGVRIHLTADHGGLPAETEIVIGHAEASVRASKPLPAEVESHIAPPDGPGAVAAAPKEPGKATPSGAPPAIVRNPPANIKPKLTKKGYVFPVYGPAVPFTNDFGAPRADTIWHHGNDIFAPEGTPILAVADGELFLVGWNDLGGQRFWLRDGQGNEFYYAHLSAFSPLAIDGAKVKAGDVIGFVGNTGDAEGTPYHLHFEVHPRQLIDLGYDGVVNPYEYLLAWKRVQDIRVDPATSWVTDRGEAPPSPAVLLDVEDISATSGLEPEALQRVLEMPDLFAESADAVR